MTSTHPVITGASGGDLKQNSLGPNRIEIHDFVKPENFRQFSLYIQALGTLSQRPSENLFSFFSIGGIHGLPAQQWGESGSAQAPTDPNQFGGYCTHGSVLFPIWHRPYVALLEQALQECAIAKAKEYKTDTEEWGQAAANFRHPYWDWAHDMNLPEEVISDKVKITTPEGEKEITNPLYAYKFKPDDSISSFPEPYKSWTTTLRHPTSSDPDAKTDVKALVNTLNANARQIRTKTYNCLQRLVTWPTFSNHTTGENGVANSLESIHDNMHVLIGGNTPAEGHMSDPAVAGFDPIFFLHHANVDRLLSLWSAVNPDVWVTDGVQPGGTYTITEDGPVGDRSNLTPFWMDQKAYWSSADIQQADVFSYTYPEFNGLEGKDPGTVRDAILQTIDKLYGSSVATAPSSSALQLTSQTVKATAVQSNTTAKANLATSSNPGFHDWTVHAKFKKFELGSSFSILFFIGPVPEDPSDWYTSPSFVGSVSAFVNSRPDRCANCASRINAEIESFVHLNEHILANYPDLPSLDPEHVKDFLKSHLSWRIEGRKADGSPADVSDLPSLKIVPFSQYVSKGPSDTRPTLGQPVYHHDVTHGKPGGALVQA